MFHRMVFHTRHLLLIWHHLLLPLPLVRVLLLPGLCALSGCHPEQNPALAGQNIYKSRQVQDTQIARLIGKVRRFGLKPC